MLPPQSILDKNKDLDSYEKHLPLRDCFLAGLFMSKLTKEKCKTTLLFALARVVMTQPQWPANNQASLQFSKRISVGILFLLRHTLLKFERFCSCKSFSNSKCQKRCMKSG